MRPAVDDLAHAIVCFVVPTPWRGQGVAHALLDAAIAHARTQGAPAVEGFSVDKPGPSQPQWLWHGTATMFRRAGFREIARRKPERPLMRLELGPPDRP